jgi:hypothetical protein
MTTQTILSNSPKSRMDKRATNSQRSLSMPKLTPVEHVRSFPNFDSPKHFLPENSDQLRTSKVFSPAEQFTIEEKSNDKEDEENSQRGRRKFGVFLTGSALGGIASTFWTYGQLKKQQVICRLFDA